MTSRDLKTVEYKKSRNRIRVISVGITLFALILLANLFNLQVVKGEFYGEEADRSYVRSSTLFDRGLIYFTDREGNKVRAATVTDGFVLAINPQRLSDDEAFEKINEITELDEEDFKERAAKKSDPYEEIKKQLTREEADAIKELEIDGVILSRESWRFYPGESLASHLLGFLSFRVNELKGSYGLELYYEDFLTRSEQQRTVNPFAEVFSNITKVENIGEASPANIVTGIDPAIQRFVENEIVTLNEKWNGEGVNAIVIDPQTGKIVSLARYPDFDLNNFREVEDSSVFRNPLVENVYEFGSVIKPLVVAGALDSDSITIENEYYDSGSIEVEDKVISNFDEKGRGYVTVQTVLSESLNTGMVNIMKDMGKEVFKKYMLSYEFGEKSAIDLPNEAKGLVDNLNSPRLLEFATASFGQGISTNYISLVKALSALGNGGYLVQPHIVTEVDYLNGDNVSVNLSKESNPQVFSQETSEEITTLLVNLVDESLGNGKYKKDHYSIAAKTGTAQIPHPDGGYYEDRNLHSFFGYFPAYDPQYLILLSIEHPKGVKYSSQTLSDPFFNITDFIINYAQISPDR